MFILLRRHIAVTVALAAALSCGFAFGQAREGSIDSARRHMELGQASFAAQAYTAAVAHFLDAYAASPFPAFLYNAGLAAEKGGDGAKAAELYRRYLDEEPAAPDAGEIEGKIRALAPEPSPRIEVVEAPVETPVEAPPEKEAEEMKSLVSIRTTPAEARIRILDGAGGEVAAFAGGSTKTVVRGAYTIEASHPDYKTVTTDLSVVPGQVYVVVVEMSQGAFLGFLSVVSDPPGAAVYVDDRGAGAVGATPWSNVLPPGSHDVWIEKPGYTAVAQKVDVSIAEKKSLEIALERLPFGLLVVKANVPGAAVYLDGAFLGAAPVENETGPGKHALLVKADGMKDYTAEVEIGRGATTKALVRLNPVPSRTPAWVSFGFAAALFAAGGAFGGVALHIDRELEADRNRGRLADDDPRITDGFLWALGADVSFGLGAILSGVCVYYFLRDPLPPSGGKVYEPVDMGEGGEPPAGPADEAAPGPAARGGSGPSFAVAPLVAPDGAGLALAVAF